MTSFAAYAMTKESDFVVEAFLDFVERAGFSEVILVFDGGASEALKARLQSWPDDAPPIRIREIDEDYWLEALGEHRGVLHQKQRHLMPVERERCDADWMMLLDIDEFPERLEEIFRVLEAAPDEVKAVSLPSAEAVWGPSEKHALPFTTRFFRVPAKRRRLWRRLAPLLYGKVFCLFDNNMLSHSLGKQFLRKGVEFEFIGTHRSFIDGKAVNKPLLEVARAVGLDCPDIYLRHYDAISLERWLEKLRYRTSQDVPYLRPERRAQVEFTCDFAARMEAAQTAEAARRIGERAFRQLYHLNLFQYALLWLLGGVVRLPAVREKDRAQ